MPNTQTETLFTLSEALQLSLRRYPLYKREQLRAWDAADEYILSYLLESGLIQNASEALILNDSFGALSLGLKKLAPEAGMRVISDSFTARKGILKNAQANQLEIGSSQFYNSLSICDSVITDREASVVKLVMIKVPKSLAHLQFQLSAIAPMISENTVLVAAAMVKHIHSSTLDIFETFIGPTKTSLAKKKARLIFCTPENIVLENYSKSEAEEILLSENETNCKLPIRLNSYPGVFAHGKLDIGTRFLLENLNTPKGDIRVMDLGCGSGALGVAAALDNPEARVSFVDESYLAIDSAKKSVAKSLTESRQNDMQFQVADDLSMIESDSLDLILNNPPFHDSAARTTNIAINMFKDSKNVLKKGGQLVVIANRHLGYHIHLKKIFGHCETLKGNQKFVILKAVKI